MKPRTVPSGDLVHRGQADLGRRLGLPVPEGAFPTPEHRLYLKLAESDSDSAHSRYNALLGSLSSFANAAECGGW